MAVNHRKLHVYVTIMSVIHNYLPRWHLAAGDINYSSSCKMYYITLLTTARWAETCAQDTLISAF